LAAECGVAAVVIVGVQPGSELLAAFGVTGVEAGVGPFVGQGAVESLYFAIIPRRQLRSIRLVISELSG
jgi:hypothetical protein